MTPATPQRNGTATIVLRYVVVAFAGVCLAFGGWAASGIQDLATGQARLGTKVEMMEEMLAEVREDVRTLLREQGHSP